MLWKIDASEEEAKERMIRTLDFQRKEKYALTVYLKTNEVPKAIGWASMREVSSGIYEDMGIAIGPDFVGKGYGKQILNALCDEARNQGAKEFHCSCREKIWLQEDCRMHAGLSLTTGLRRKQTPEREKYTWW